MDVRVYWTKSAKDQLSEIGEYYKQAAGNEVARKILLSIYEKTLLLEKHPLMGQVEELLEGRKHQYRYLVSGKYKIIYWIEDKYAKIATVFDCRQNPIKMKDDLGSKE